MKNKPRKPAIPAERHGTIRQEITEALKGRRLSAKELSAEVGVSEKDISEHLEHIRKTLDKRDASLVVIPSECKKCGFIFRKRERLNKPGKCPVCRSESIQEPLFSIALSDST